MRKHNWQPRCWSSFLWFLGIWIFFFKLMRVSQCFYSLSLSSYFCNYWVCALKLQECCRDRDGGFKRFCGSKHRWISSSSSLAIVQWPRLLWVISRLLCKIRTMKPWQQGLVNDWWTFFVSKVEVLKVCCFSFWVGWLHCFVGGAGRCNK